MLIRLDKSLFYLFYSILLGFFDNQEREKREKSEKRRGKREKKKKERELEKESS